MPESRADPETIPRATDVSPPPRPIRMRSFVLFFLVAVLLLALMPIAADALSVVCGWVLFLVLLLVAAIVLTYYEVILNRRQSSTP